MGGEAGLPSAILILAHAKSATFTTRVFYLLKNTERLGWTPRKSRRLPPSFLLRKKCDLSRRPFFNSNWTILEAGMGAETSSDAYHPLFC